MFMKHLMGCRASARQCGSGAVLPASKPLGPFGPTHGACTLYTSKAIGEAQISKMEKQQTPKSWSNRNLTACGTGCKANNSVSVFTTSTSTGRRPPSARVSYSSCASPPFNAPSPAVLCPWQHRNARPLDASRAPEDVRERARSQDAVRLTTLLYALLLRYLCVPLPLPPPQLTSRKILPLCVQLRFRGLIIPRPHICGDFGNTRCIKSTRPMYASRVSLLIGGDCGHLKKWA
ncbi:hypothetical protein C8J57DRAFT_1224052 [Mycena rebaudengoi]|nr:hypothetical protein C8J57DRAFT_1224052 [Mycena rebaudengoi]